MMGSSDNKDNGDAVSAGGGGGPSVSLQQRHQVYIRNLAFSVNREKILQSIEESAKVDMSSLLEIRIARTGRVHDRPTTGKGAGDKMCSAFVIFKDYEAARIMGDHWHGSRWKELGGHEVVCKVEALQGGGPPPPKDESHKPQQQCPFAPPQQVPQHAAGFGQQMPFPPVPPPPPIVMMGPHPQFHNYGGYYFQQQQQQRPQQVVPGPPPTQPPPCAGPPGVQICVRPNRSAAAAAAKCQASPLEVPAGDGEKKREEKEDDRRNQKEESTKEEEKEADEKPGKDNVKKGDEGLLQVKTEEVDSPTSFASQLPPTVQPLTPPARKDDDTDCDDDEKLVEQKWRQQHGQEDSEEHDDEEFQNQLKQHFKDRVVATEDPYILDDEELSATSPWQRRVEKRRNKKAQEGLDDATTATVLQPLPPEKPELETIKDELEKNEARSREIMGVKNK